MHLCSEVALIGNKVLLVIMTYLEKKQIIIAMITLEMYLEHTVKMDVINVTIN